MMTTEIWGLGFKIKGKRLCFITRTPQGTEKNFWVDMPSRMAKAIGDIVKEYTDNKIKESKLSYEQLVEKYKEYGGS